MSHFYPFPSGGQVHIPDTYDVLTPGRCVYRVVAITAFEAHRPVSSVDVADSQWRLQVWVSWETAVSLRTW